MTQINADGDQRDPQSYAVIGAAMEVHRELGHGFPSIKEAQVIHYLKATNLAKALLINFGSPHLECKHLVFNLRPSASSADNES